MRNDTLKQVGEQFGIEKYSTVSSIVERVKYEMKVDKSLKQRIQDLADKITKSQRQTWPIYVNNAENSRYLGNLETSLSLCLK